MALSFGDYLRFTVFAPNNTMCSRRTAYVKQEIKSYWFRTGTPTFLVNYLKEAHYYIPDLDGNVELDEEGLQTYRAVHRIHYQLICSQQRRRRYAYFQKPLHFAIFAPILMVMLNRFTVLPQYKNSPPKVQNLRKVLDIPVINCNTSSATQQLSNSATQQLSNSATQQLSNSATQA